MLNKIHNMDCVEGMRRLPDNSIDLTVTSPPYDNLRTYNGYSWDFEETAKELYRITKPGGVVVWIVGDATVKGSETGTSFKQALFFKECGFNMHDTMIWEKPTFTATGSLAVRYGSVFEYMFVFSKGKPKAFNPIKDKPNKTAGTTLHGTIRQKNGSTRQITGAGKKTIQKYGQRHNVWHLPTELAKRNGHPAPFPEQLANDHIISWSNEGDTVLDPFMGSGTTAVACIKNSRNYIGYEISKEYCEIANKRLEETKNGI
jgi:site-specific DNA-methyltransferase (adenine-specific)